MIAPYDEVFNSLEHYLQNLNFKKESNDSHGASFLRPDGYRLVVSIERYGEGFSADLHKVDQGADGHLWPECLMETISMESAKAAKNALQLYGFNWQGISCWWKEFLRFLQVNEKIIFTFPLREPYRTAYQNIYKNKMNELIK